MIRHLVPALAVLALLAGCSDEADPSRPVGDATPGVLRVLAGSELADLQPVLDEAAKATGVSVKFSFTGTIERGGQTITSTFSL